MLGHRLRQSAQGATVGALGRQRAFLDDGAGSRGEREASISALAIAGAFFTPMMTASVAPERASAAQSTKDFSWPGGRWPETTVNPWTMPR